MARVRMVTRTVEVTKATCLVVDTLTSVCLEVVLEVSGTYKTNDEVLKAVKKAHELPTSIIATVKSTEVEEICYGMKEIDFIKSATRLDPTTRKLLEETETSEE